MSFLEKGRTRLNQRENNVLKASVRSGYSKSSYYYRPKQQPVVSSSSRNRRSDSTETEAASLLEAIEKVALEHPSYGVRRITAMPRQRYLLFLRSPALHH
ncbi:MAG: hypothetical protein WBP83_12755 [Nitrososphaeraceae archaeon]